MSLEAGGWIRPADLSDPETVALLKVARSEVVAHGLRRLSVGEIARQARVSRPTVYRRIGDKDQIIRLVVGHEVVAFLAGAAARYAQLDNATDRTVEAFCEAITAWRANDVASAVVEFDPEILLRNMREDEDSAFTIAQQLVAGLIAGGDMSLESARPSAAALLRLTTTLLVYPPKALPFESEDDVRQFAADFIRPVIDALVARSRSAA